MQKSVLGAGREKCLRSISIWTNMSDLSTYEDGQEVKKSPRKQNTYIVKLWIALGCFWNLFLKLPFLFKTPCRKPFLPGRNQRNRGISWRGGRAGEGTQICVSFSLGCFCWQQLGKLNYPCDSLQTACTVIAKTRECSYFAGFCCAW